MSNITNHWSRIAPLLIIFALSCKTPMKTIVHTKEAPLPIGPYSQAVLINHTLYASGQIAIDPASGNLVLESIEAETKQVMKNISAVLHAVEMDFSHVVKATIFLANMNDFPKVNEVYGSFFKDHFPARETVQVARLPKDVNVEISVIAVK
jgi:2-iminobutanoate/2-iminopropanoate deaminase